MGAEDQTVAEVEAGRLAGLLLRAAEITRHDVASAVTAFDLPLPLARAVIQLDHPAPMRDLAEDLSCDRSYVTGMADGLEERGLVQRVPGTDRRVKLLTLTDKGRALRAELLAAVGRQSRVLNNLANDEQAALDRLLTAMLAIEPGACPLESRL